MYQNKQGQPQSAGVRTQNLKLNSRSVAQSSSRPFETTFSPMVSPSDGFCSATLDNNSYDLYSSSSSLYNDQMLWESAFEVPGIKLESDPLSNELPNLVKAELADDVHVNTSWTNELLGRDIKEEIEETGETKNAESGQNGLAHGLATGQAYKEYIRTMTDTNVNISYDPSSRDESTTLDRFKCNRVNSFETCQSTEAISAIDLSSKPQVVDNSMKLHFINGNRLHSNSECLVDSNINNKLVKGNSPTLSPSDSTRPYNLELCNMALKVAQCVSVCLTEESSKEIIMDGSDNDAADVYDTNTALLRISPETNILSNTKKNKKAMQLEKQKVKHPLRERCNCREFVTKCSSIKDSQMVCIHNEFWQSDLAGRRSFYEAMVVSKEVKRRRRDTDKTKVVKGDTCENENKRLRTVTHLYHLPLSVNEGPVMVCKRMFLATLGLTNSSSLVSFLRAKAKDPKSRNYLSESRGGDRKSDSDKLKAMIDHINSYNPITLDCCRRNGNNIRYLPKDLTVLSMFTDFKGKYPDYKVCVETYRRVVKTVNVLTRVPYSVACEFCSKQKNDDKASLEELGTA